MPKKNHHPTCNCLVCRRKRANNKRSRKTARNNPPAEYPPIFTQAAQADIIRELAMMGPGDIILGTGSTGRIPAPPVNVLGKLLWMDTADGRRAALLARRVRSVIMLLTSFEHTEYWYAELQVIIPEVEQERFTEGAILRKQLASQNGMVTGVAKIPSFGYLEQPITREQAEQYADEYKPWEKRLYAGQHDYGFPFGMRFADELMRNFGRGPTRDDNREDDT